MTDATQNIYEYIMDKPAYRSLTIEPEMLTLLQEELRSIENRPPCIDMSELKEFKENNIKLLVENGELRKENELQQTMIDSWIVYEKDTNTRVSNQAELIICLTERLVTLRSKIQELHNGLNAECVNHAGTSTLLADALNQRDAYFAELTHIDKIATNQTQEIERLKTREASSELPSKS